MQENNKLYCLIKTGMTYLPFLFLYYQLGLYGYYKI